MVTLNDFFYHEDANVSRTIFAVYQHIAKLEDLPWNPKIEAEIKECRDIILNLKRNRYNIIEKRMAESMKVAKKYSRDQGQKRGKRQTWKGLTREQLSSRDQSIIEHFRKTGLTKNNYSNKYAKKYALKPTTVRHILSKAVGI